MIKKIFVLLVFCAIAAILRAQDDSTFLMPQTHRQVAHRQIRGLHHGTLIVRLNTKRKQIENYRNAGNTALAETIEDEIIAINETLLKHCYSGYNFGNIYFAKMDDISQLKAGDTAIVYDGSLTITQKIILQPDSVFYLDYGILMGEEAAENIPDSRFTKKESNTIINYKAVVLRDIYNKQLISPMPYFSAGIVVNLNKKVEILNQDLWDYYTKVLKRNNETVNEEEIKIFYKKKSERAKQFFYNFDAVAFRQWFLKK